MLFNGFALILGVLAASFVLWPLLTVKRLVQSGPDDHRIRDETNIALYKEHLKDLQLSVDRGDIPKEQFERLKLALQRNLLDDSPADAKPINTSRVNTRVLLITAVLLPFAAMGVYHWLGAASDWEIFQLVQRKNNSVANTDGSVTELDQKLKTKLYKRTKMRPENTQNWYLLAALSMEQQDLEETIRAYRAILEQQPNSPQIMAELAQVLFIQASSQVTDEVRQYVLKALKLNPNSPTALGLAGIDAFQTQQFEAAIGYWERAIAELGMEAPGSRILAGGIAKAQEALNKAKSVEKARASDTKLPEENIAKVLVSVSLGELVKVEPTDTVFIYARAWQGPKMPLAISKVMAADLPLTVELNKSMAMAPGMDITRFDQLELVARISRSGNPAAEEGDWQAQVGPIKINSLSGPVELLIKEQIAQ